MLKVGIKYCGGCKATFDRMAVIEKVKKDNIYIYFDYVNTTDNYDLILVVQGCGVQCASLKNLNTKNGFLQIKNDDIEDIQNRLESIKNK